MASFEEIANMPDESVSEKGGSSNGGIVFAGTLHGQVLVCDELPDEVRPWYARKTTILLGFIALSIIAAFEVWHLLGYCTPLLLPKGIVFSFGASMLQFVFGLLWVICFALNAMRFVRFDMKVSSAFKLCCGHLPTGLVRWGVSRVFVTLFGTASCSSRVRGGGYCRCDAALCRTYKGEIIGFREGLTRDGCDDGACITSGLTACRVDRNWRC